MTAASAHGAWEFWIDRGGTFTDVVAQRPGRRARHRTSCCRRIPSGTRTPPSPASASCSACRPARRSRPSAIGAVKMGTTVATNALLERKGEPHGAGDHRAASRDALRIAYQNRPRIFDRHIVLPELLYSRVIEVDERIGAHGEVVAAARRGGRARDLQAAYDDGYRAVAIVLMHGYRYPAARGGARRDRRARSASRRCRCRTRSSPLMKLVARGDTTVVDAYLSPILRRYVEQVGRRTAGRAAAVHAVQRRPDRRAPLPGQGLDPVRARRAASSAWCAPPGAPGFDRVIGFDMGGTSTDVSHFAGEFERAFETQVAGVRMRAPMMSIHTVAAGGGSILHFDGSAATASARTRRARTRGRPATGAAGRSRSPTATSCSARSSRRSSRTCSGRDGDQPLDADVVRERVRGARRARSAPATGRSAVAGAGGRGLRRHRRRQHGRRDQADLGAARPRRHRVHAVGLRRRRRPARLRGRRRARHDAGLRPPARRRAVRLRHGPRRPDGDARGSRSSAASRPTRWTRSARRSTGSAPTPSQDLQSQGVAASRIRVVRRAHLRYDGTDTALIVPAGTLGQMQARLRGGVPASATRS